MHVISTHDWYQFQFIAFSEAEKEREREFWAVVKVQAWFRAQRIRSYLK